MKKPMKLLQKSIVALMVCLLITGTVTPLPVYPDYSEEPGYSSYAAPNPVPAPDKDPFGEGNEHD